MQDAVEFMQRVLDTEYQARRAELLEPDYAEFRRKWEALEALGDFPGLGAGIYRAPDDAIPDREEAERTLQTFSALRQQMYAETYTHPEHGEVYMATVSTTFSSEGNGIADWRAASRLTAIRSTDGWRVATWEDACLTCGTSGVVGAQACVECNGQGWVLTGGRRLMSLTDPDHVYNFSPTDLTSLR